MRPLAKLCTQLYTNVHQQEGQVEEIEMQEVSYQLDIAAELVQADAIVALADTRGTWVTTSVYGPDATDLMRSHGGAVALIYLGYGAPNHFLFH